MSDLTNQIALVALGWLLGTLSQGIERRRQEYLEKRRILTRLDRILITVVIELEANRLLGTDRVLAEPPTLPEDFDNVVDQLGDWEARRGEYDMHFRLITLKRLVVLAREGYSTLDGKEDVPESGYAVYSRELSEVKNMAGALFESVQEARLGPIRRIKKRLFKSKGSATKATQNEQA